MAAKRQLESIVKRSILEFLVLQYPRGTFWINRNSAVFDKSRGVFIKPKGKFELPGVSDIFGLLDGTLIALEVKTPENKKRPPEQVNFIELVKSHGHCAGFVTSIEDAKLLIEGFIAKKEFSQNRKV